MAMLMFYHFNSTMVRLKDREISFLKFQNENFNSTMVRLKVRIGKVGFSGDILFQFHYGTIKSHLASPASCYDVISIPLWYD